LVVPGQLIEGWHTKLSALLVLESYKLALRDAHHGVFYWADSPLRRLDLAWLIEAVGLVVSIAKTCLLLFNGLSLNLSQSGIDLCRVKILILGSFLLLG
jgi:hypothetical protein